MFYNAIHLSCNSSAPSVESESFEAPSRSKKTRLNVGGSFNLISFNGKNVGNFNFKEFLIGEEPTFVKVKVIIDGISEKNGFIDLSEHADLLGRITGLNEEQTSQRINDYILSILELDTELAKNMKVFMHLGIDNKTDQELIMKSKGRDIIGLAFVFNRLFLGETVQQKIQNYEEKKTKVKDDVDSLLMLDKICLVALSVKVLRNEVSITDIPSHLFTDEIKIVDKAKTEFYTSIYLAIVNNYKLLINVFSVILHDKFNYIIYALVKYGKQELIKDILSEYPRFNRFFISYSNTHENSTLLKYCLSVNPKELDTAISDAAFKDKERMLGMIEPLQSSDPEGFDTYIEQIVYSAASAGHIPLVFNSLFKKPEYSEKAVQFAVVNKQEKLLHAILGYRDFKRHENKALLYASYEGNESIIEHISSQYRTTIPMVVFKEAIRLAIEKNKENSIEVILRSVTRIQIPVAVKEYMEKILISPQEEEPVEIFISRIIADNINKIAESINISYAESVHESPNIHNQNRIKFYLKQFISHSVLDDHLSNLSMSKKEVLIKFLEKFNLEVLKEEILSSLIENPVFKEKLDSFYQNELFKGHISNYKIEAKIKKYRVKLVEFLKNLVEIKSYLTSKIDPILGSMSFDNKIEIFRLLKISENKTSFKSLLKANKKPDGTNLLHLTKADNLFNEKLKIDEIFDSLKEIQLIHGDLSLEKIINEDEDKLMQLFIDKKQNIVESCLLEDFKNDHTTHGMIRSSGLDFILTKLGFLKP